MSALSGTAGFCMRCGGAWPHPPPVVCGACGYAQWVNPRPTASVIIVDEQDRFLAIRRVHSPNAGRWDLPGGFIEAWEPPAEAAIREAREELGLRVRLGAFVGMHVGAYDYQDERLPLLNLFWLATIAGGELTLDPAEASEHAWFPLAEPPEMAFPDQNRALADAWDGQFRTDKHRR